MGVQNLHRDKAAFFSGRVQPEVIGIVVVMVGFGSGADYCTAQSQRPLTGRVLGLC